jgi:hypothetical protein
VKVIRNINKIRKKPRRIPIEILVPTISVPKNFGLKAITQIKLK